MTNETCDLLMQTLTELMERVSVAHSKLAAMEITLRQYQPNMADAYTDTEREIRKTHAPVQFSPEDIVALRKALLRG